VLILRAILRLTRLGTSLIGFVGVFLPLLARTNQVWTSLGRAIPLLFTCICTFIANDLDDVERDRVNHPERPLPAGELSRALAGILYFTSLGLALFSTRYYVTQGIAFLYYGLIATSISYGYVVECFPSFKAPFVAAVSSIPVLIVVAWYPEEVKLYIIAGSVFLISLGREVCMDITDRDGDSVSFMHRFNPKRLAVVAFCVEAIGVLLLVVQARTLEETLMFIVILSVFVVSGLLWFRFSKYGLSTFLMKMQFIVGLYFLL